MCIKISFKEGSLITSIVLLFHSNLKRTHKLVDELTLLPFNFPGVQLGMLFTSRIASSSHSGHRETPLNTFISEISPVLETLKFK